MTLLEKHRKDFAKLQLWWAAVKQDCPTLEELDTHQEVVLGCIPACKFEVHLPPSLRNEFVLERLQHHGKTFAKQYRYWFVFDKKRHHLILLLYPY